MYDVTTVSFLSNQFSPSSDHCCYS